MNSIIKIATLLSVLIIACSIFFSCGKESDNDWDSGDNTEVSETMEKSDAENGSSSEEAVSVIKDGGKYDFNK